jgi:hypothetical protein
MSDQVVVRGASEGTTLWMLGGLYEVKATTDETDGAMTVMEMTIPVGTGPPPHVHDCAEAAYVRPAGSTSSLPRRASPPPRARYHRRWTARRISSGWRRSPQSTGSSSARPSLSSSAHKAERKIRDRGVS